MLLYVIVMTHKTRKASGEELLVRLRKGEVSATRDWFECYAPEIRDYVSYKIDQPQIVEEIVQETFINCLKQLPLFSKKSSLATWMKSIARHEVADYYRQYYAKQVWKLIPFKEHLLNDEGLSKSSLKSKVVDKVRRALCLIRADYKELLLLKYVDEKKVKNMARELGRSFKSVEADLFRARQDFKEVYASLSS